MPRTRQLSPTLARAVCAAFAVAALLSAVIAGGDLYFAGFPDSHLTDYDTAAATPKRILIWAEVGLVVVFGYLAVASIGARARTLGLIAAVAVFGVVVLVQWFGIPWYFIEHRGLDNGIGG